MANVDKHIEAQNAAIREAILKYYISPQLLLRVCEFAEEQNAFFLKYDGATGLFHLSDGEAYTAEAVLAYFGIPAPQNIF
jgi:hypothetical protein